MDVLRPGLPSLPFMSCPEIVGSRDEYLLTVHYTRVQKNSPQFASVYGSVDQSVDVKMSTFIFQAAPEPILALYDFIMTTFVPDRSQANAIDEPGSPANQPASQAPTSEPQCIKVAVNLQSIKRTYLYCTRASGTHSTYL